MPSPALRMNSYDNRASLPARLAAALISLGVVALILATLIAMGMLDTETGSPGQRLTAIQLAGASKPRREKALHAKTAEKRSAAPRRAAVAPLPRPPRLPSPVPKPSPANMIELSKADFAASDISRLSRNSQGSSGDDGGSGGSAATYGPGAGPGGARLYKAEWYRRPSHAELAGYLTAGAPPGSWAMIACRTIDHFHVEDCRQIGESPPGSGLSRALRLAAWQFLVRPPRIDGKPLVGAWVSIRFDFTRPPGSDPDR